MAVYVSNIVIEQGYDFETTFELENSITNEPLDLSTYELPDAVIRKTYSSSNISATFSTEFVDAVFGKSTTPLIIPSLFGLANFPGTNTECPINCVADAILNSDN